MYKQHIKSCRGIKSTRSVYVDIEKRQISTIMTCDRRETIFATIEKINKKAGNGNDWRSKHAEKCALATF